MSDLSWWERHLGGVVRQPQQQQQPSPSSFGPAVRWQPQYPPTGPRPVAGTAQQAQPESNGDSTYERVQQQGYNQKKPQNVGKVGTCPECGGSNFFQRKWAHKEAAPLCTDCGYNGEYFTQSGSLLNVMGVSSAAPVAFARSDNPSGEAHFGVDPGVPSDFSFNSVR